MDEVASALLETDYDGDDVPGALGHGKGKYKPLGRYLRQQLRLKIGRSKDVPLAVKEKMIEEMQPLRAFAFSKSRSLKGVVKEVYEPQTLRLENQYHATKKGKRL